MPRILFLLVFSILTVTVSSQTKKRQRHLDSLLVVLQTSKVDTNTVTVLNKIADERNAFNDYDAAINIADSALILAEKLGFKIGIAVSYFLHGCSYKGLSNYSKALEYFQKSLSISEQFGKKGWIARNTERIGIVYDNLSDYPNALEYSQKALFLMEQMDNKAGIAANHVYIGKIYFSLLDCTKALENYQKGYTIYEKLGNKDDMADILGYMGLVYNYLSDFPKALDYEQKALSLYEQLKFEEFKNSHDNAFILSNIGSIYVNLTDYPKALEYYQKALQKIQETTGEKHAIALMYNNIGEVYQKEGNQKEALKYETMGLSLAKEMGAKDLIRDAYRTVAIIDSSMNNFKGAYENHKLFTVYNDSIFNIQKEQKITSMQLKFEFDRVQDSTKAVNDTEVALKSEAISKQEFRKNAFIVGFILVLILAVVLYRMFRSKHKANVILTANSKIISEMLEEKDLLMKEIHHRVKNNLEVISSLLELQSVGMMDGKAKTAIDAGQSRVQSISLIHHKLYRTDSVAHIEFTGFIKDLFEQISKVFRSDGAEVLLNIKGEELLLEIDVAVPLGLILNELFTNSFKYAVGISQQNLFSVELIKVVGDNSKYKIIYRDNGPGLPKDFNMNKSTSLGMKVIHLLTKQLGGKVNYYNDNGSVFEITININRKV